MLGISIHSRQAGYNVVISPNRSTRYSLDPGCSSYCHCITAVIRHSTDLVRYIIPVNMLHFKFHFALVPLLQTLLHLHLTRVALLQ